jgi:hypothetical protein
MQDREASGVDLSCSSLALDSVLWRSLTYYSSEQTFPKYEPRILHNFDRSWRTGALSSSCNSEGYDHAY